MAPPHHTGAQTSKIATSADDATNWTLLYHGLKDLVNRRAIRCGSRFPLAQVSILSMHILQACALDMLAYALHCLHRSTSLGGMDRTVNLIKLVVNNNTDSMAISHAQTCPARYRYV